MKFYTNKQIILASNSPRRKELLNLINLPFRIVPSTYAEEQYVFTGEVDQYVEGLALEKAKAVSEQYPDALVIGADTIVSIQNQLLGKPSTPQQALEFLRLLNGNMHTVQTGVAFCVSGETMSFSVKTNVYFKRAEESLLQAYVASRDPMDKAGAYGIQTAGALLVDRIEGDYYNVVGLPIASVTSYMLEQRWISLKEGTNND